MDALAVLLPALLWDLLLGEPPAKFHPVVWFGRTAGFLDGRWKRRGPLQDFLAGALTALLVIGFALALSLLPPLPAELRFSGLPPEKLLRGKEPPRAHSEDGNGGHRGEAEGRLDDSEQER